MENQLLESFSESNFENWKAAAAEESKKKVSELELIEIDKDIIIQSFYDASFRKESPAIILPVGQDKYFGARAWHNLPPIVVSNEKESNKKALHALDNGADGVFFIIRKENCRAGDLLSGIDMEICQLNFSLQGTAHSFINSFADYADKNHNPKNIKGLFFGVDDLILPNEFEKLKSLGIKVEASPTVQQLAPLLHQVVLKIESNKKVSPNAVLNNIGFSIDCQSNFFLEIAKLRALRILWNCLIEGYSVSEINPYIHSLAIVNRDEVFEPHANMLNSTFSGMASILGGCDGISIFPENPDDAMMSRIAQNVPIILREESNLHRVADPAAGSHLIEHLTNTIAEKSWQQFLNLVKS
ncbi:MAG: hypothetical protein HC811_05445 [Flammeovirgaceae bacterium]|nr:hypothetical protein [Flammeovirgaceae bacterium]